MRIAARFSANVIIMRERCWASLKMGDSKFGNAIFGDETERVYCTKAAA